MIFCLCIVGNMVLLTSAFVSVSTFVEFVSNSVILSSELQSTATSPTKPKLNDHKRHGSPLAVDGEDRTSKRMLCIVSKPHSEVETPCPIEKKAEDKQSVFVGKSGASIFSASSKVKPVLYSTIVNAYFKFSGCLLRKKKKKRVPACLQRKFSSSCIFLTGSWWQ